MDGLSARDLASICARFPTIATGTPCSTPNRCKALIEKEKAIFVDIRYPADFASVAYRRRHQPRLRRMPTEVMNEHIAKLPKRPIIVPCYDRRSAASSREVLGYELTKAGHDLRGRYTVPWEYFIATRAASAVRQGVARGEQQEPLGQKSAESLAGVLSPVSQWTGVVAVDRSAGVACRACWSCRSR